LQALQRKLISCHCQILQHSQANHRESVSPEVTITMTTRFLTETEVSNQTHISLGTLRRWRLENKGPKFHKFGSLVRYGEDDLANWQETQPSGGTNRTRIEPTSVRGHSQLRRSG
jgi:predicted DNA-binding transcriptional regulator AlpA